MGRRICIKLSEDPASSLWKTAFQSLRQARPETGKSPQSTEPKRLVLTLAEPDKRRMFPWNIRAILARKPATSDVAQGAAATVRPRSFSKIIGPNCETLPAPSVRIMSPSFAAAAATLTASENEFAY